MSYTVFTPALDSFISMRTPKGDLLTKPFLRVCSLVLPIIDKFGTSMALVKSDVGGNITRLEARYETDEESYNVLYNIVLKEIADKAAKQSSSCASGLLWLTRGMDFLVELFRNLLLHPDWTMTQAANEAYVLTLKKWHGWLASAAFTVAIKLVPDRNKFFDMLGEGNLNEDIERFIANFGPVLAENHKFLQSIGVDDVKAS